MVREQLSSLDSVQLNFHTDTGIVMGLILALIMFGVALDIKPKTLLNIFKSPKSIITGILLQWFGLPLVTFLLIVATSSIITPMVAFGMILVASCPGGNISNFMSKFSKGNIELSVSLAAVSTISCPFITPFNFWFWGNLYLKFASLSGTVTVPKLVIPFSEIFTTVFLILAIPITLGILCGHYLPGLTKKITKPFSIFSLVIFFAMVVAMFVPNREIFVKYIIFILVIVFFHNLAAFGTGYFGAMMMKLPVRDRRSLTIEVGIQNSGLGLTLLLNPAIFDPQIWNNPETGVMYGGMMFVIAWWGIWHIIAGLTLSTCFRHSKLPASEQ